MRRGLGAAIAGLLCVAVALHALRYRTVLGWYPAHDLYAYFYPKALYAVAALRDGGRGLLWNPYQNCGQPFSALPQTGLWYPVYLFFLVFRPETALRAVLTAHLVIGGLGAYALGRELGARPTAALAGALAFEMGNAMMALTISAPIHAAPFAWLPLALWACERLLRAPSLPRALTLALVLTVAILPGMPQTVFMTYQLIALRVLWELLTRRGGRQTLPFFVVALAIPVALAAIELLPELEVMAQSLRSVALGAREVSPRDQWSLAQLRSQLALRSSLQPFVLVPAVVGAVAMTAHATRRAAVFYAGAGVLFLALAWGPGSPVYELYRHLPLTELFRQPVRFLWITSFCLAVLAALGSEALATVGSSGGRARPLAAVGAAAAALGLFHLATPQGLVPFEWAAAGLVLVAGVGGLVVPGASRWAPLVVVVALALQTILAPASNALYLLPGEPEYFAASQAADAIRSTLGPEDRVHLVHRHPDLLQYRMMPKTASLLRLPAVSDYEPLATRRYAELFTMMLSGRPLVDLNQFLYAPAPSPRALNRRLLDLTAVRYLLVDNGLVPDVDGATPPFRRVAAGDEFSVYENPQHLPRAFYTPPRQRCCTPLRTWLTPEMGLSYVTYRKRTPLST